LVTTVKVGGSILRDAAAYAEAARLLLPLLDEGAHVVVSAAHGVTSRLQALAAGAAQPDEAGTLRSHHAALAGALPDAEFPSLEAALQAARAHDATPLLAWGERASAWALRQQLRAAGRDVPVHELDLRRPAPAGPAIVPGFFLWDRRGRLRVLPRGGSDISAVLVAVRNGGRTVRLWKQGGGIHDGPVVLPATSAAALLRRIGGSIHPLHPAALHIARARRLTLRLEDPSGRWPATLVHPGPALEVAA
jgi:aspartokinase